MACQVQWSLTLGITAILVWGSCSKPTVPRTNTTSEVAMPEKREATKSVLSEAERKDLIAQATGVAKEHGLSIEGLEPKLTEYRALWNVSFSGPLERGKSGGTGFTVRIDKSGMAPPQIFKFQ
jgi:hypothetical protein